ncbi:MAG: hypothetical protein KGL39_28095 [Patescibacteria group bacterium]|nr:hypothetical protein [Patescibacteria group bacterium]
MHWRTVGAEERIPQRFLDQSEIEVYEDYAVRNIAVKVRGYLLSHHFANDTYEAHLSLPADWWQAFKHRFIDRWWMRWYVKRHPVEMKKYTASIKVARMHTYPEAPIPCKNSGQTFVLEEVSDPEWSVQ